MSKTTTPDLAAIVDRKKLALLIVTELFRQDGEDVEEGFDPFSDGDLTLPWLDQNDVDFGKIADVILDAYAEQVVQTNEAKLALVDARHLLDLKSALIENHEATIAALTAEVADLQSQRRHLAAKEQHWKAQATSMIAVLGRVQDELPLRLRAWSHKRFRKWITWSTAWKFRDELFADAALTTQGEG